MQHRDSNASRQQGAPRDPGAHIEGSGEREGGWPACCTAQARYPRAIPPFSSVNVGIIPFGALIFGTSMLIIIIPSW